MLPICLRLICILCFTCETTRLRKGKDSMRLMTTTFGYATGLTPERLCIKGGRKTFSFVLLLLLLLGNIYSKQAHASSSANVPMQPLWGGVAAAMASVPVESSSTVLLHHFEMECNYCHDNSGNNGNSGPVTKNINNLCTSNCHNYDTEMNHPVNVTSPKGPSEGLPLVNNRITCLTCHSKESDPLGEPMLETKRDSQLCITCHAQMPGDLKQRSHWQSSMQAHLGSINEESTTSINIKSVSTDAIDIESNGCIGCHSDKTVTIIPFSETHSQKRQRWGTMKDHPIGINYEDVATKKATVYPYRYPIVNSKIRLFNGKVGCGSCHSLYADNKNNVIASDNSTSLCKDCHAN